MHVCMGGRRTCVGASESESGRAWLDASGRVVGATGATGTAEWPTARGCGLDGLRGRLVCGR
jgi:hypothetical protein